MRALLEGVEPGGDDITCLTKYEGDALWQCWVNPMLEENKTKPGTIISYLTSYEKFLKFMTNPRYSRFGPPLSHDHRELLALLLPDVKGWRSIVDGQTQDVQNQRYLDEIETLLTAEEVLQLRSSKPYVDRQKVIKQAAEGKDLTELEFTIARDFLITRFAMDAGSRPGPMNNAKLEDYRTAKSEDGVKVMLVARHKRSKDGPVILPMLADMQEYMATYIDVIRPKFALKDEQKIFVTTEGRGFWEGTIGRISSFCKKAGIRLQVRLAAVNWRKLVSTAMKEKATPQEAELVRKVMAHSKQTANRSYVRRKLTKVGAEAVKIIARVTAPGEEQPKKEEAQENPHDAPGTSGIEASALLAEPSVSGFPSAPSTAKSLLPPSDCSVAVLTTSTNVVPPTPPPSFNQKQKEAIERVFNDEITKGKKTTLEKAQKKCCTTAILSADKK